MRNRARRVFRTDFLSGPRLHPGVVTRYGGLPGASADGLLARASCVLLANSDLGEAGRGALLLLLPSSLPDPGHYTCVRAQHVPPGPPIVAPAALSAPLLPGATGHLRPTHGRAAACGLPRSQSATPGAFSGQCRSGPPGVSCSIPLRAAAHCGTWGCPENALSLTGTWGSCRQLAASAPPMPGTSARVAHGFLRRAAATPLQFLCWPVRVTAHPEYGASVGRRVPQGARRWSQSRMASWPRPCTGRRQGHRASARRLDNRDSNH